MKFVPVTMMVLPVYALIGDIAVAVGSAVTVSIVPETATVVASEKVSSTDDAPAGVVAPMTTVTSVALT